MVVEDFDGLGMLHGGEPEASLIEGVPWRVGGVGDPLVGWGDLAVFLLIVGVADTVVADDVELGDPHGDAAVFFVEDFDGVVEGDLGAGKEGSGELVVSALDIVERSSVHIVVVKDDGVVVLSEGGFHDDVVLNRAGFTPGQGVLTD